MLALIAALALAQSDAPRLETLTPQQLRMEIDILEAGRPALYAPIGTLIVGAVLEAVAGILFVVTSQPDAPLGLAWMGIGTLIGGGISLGTTLWGRSQVGAMIDERERRLR